MAVDAKVLSLDDISLDGTNIHADASKSKAVSYGHLVTLRAALTADVDELLRLGEAADGSARPDSVEVSA